MQYAGEIVTEKPLARILIVDDEAHTANVLKRGLKILGFDAYSYSNPIDAFYDLRAHPTGFCAVVTHLRMPEMTGFELNY